MRFTVPEGSRGVVTIVRETSLGAGLVGLRGVLDSTEPSTKVQVPQKQDDRLTIATVLVTSYLVVLNHTVPHG